MRVSIIFKQKMLKKFFSKILLFLLILMFFSCSNSIIQKKNIGFDITITLPTSDKAKVSARSSDDADWNIKAWVETKDVILQTINQTGSSGENITLKFDNITIGETVRACIEFTQKDEESASYAGTSEWITIESGVNTLSIELEEILSITYAGTVTGTEVPIFYIYEADGLVIFRDMVNGSLLNDTTTTYEIPADPSITDETSYNVTTKLTNIKGVLKSDIDLSETEWTPIGTVADPFVGDFDGENHTISGISIKKQSPNVGLFGCVSNNSTTSTTSTIENLVVEGKIEFVGAEEVASLIGGFAGSATNVSFKNCINNVSINFFSNYGYSYIGGIVGEFNGCTFENCINLADITTTEYTGGIAGSSVIDANSSTFDKCINIGNISVSSKNGGGIVGVDTTVTLTVSNCLNLGTIGSESATYISGIVGYGSTVSNTVSNCLSAGTLLGSTDLYAIDSTASDETYTNNYYDSSIINLEQTIEDDITTCSAKTTEELTTANPFDDSSAENWSFEKGRYPLPNVQNSIPKFVWEELIDAATP